MYMYKSELHCTAADGLLTSNIPRQTSPSH